MSIQKCLQSSSIILLILLLLSRITCNHAFLLNQPKIPYGTIAHEKNNALILQSSKVSHDSKSPSTSSIIKKTRETLDSINDKMPRTSPSSVPKIDNKIQPFQINNKNKSQSIKQMKKRHEDPNHVAFICDGNSRWSQNNGSSRDTFWGHSNGASRVLSIIKYIQNKYRDIDYVTMYAFSTENWSRSQDEIDNIWKVLEQFSSKFYDWVLQNNIQLKIIGDLSDQRIPLSLKKSLIALEEESSWNTDEEGESESHNANERKGLTICIAINYGGRRDIINASLKMAESISRGEIILDDFSNNIEENDGNEKSYHDFEKKFSELLCTSNIPDPDLVIRTGGERRLSNFLIWNCAYSELYFTDVLWPDYDEKELDKALKWYKGRDRRFGGR